MSEPLPTITLTLEQAAALTSAASIVVAAFERIGGGAEVVQVADLTAGEAQFLAELEALGLIERRAAAGAREHVTFAAPLLEAITHVGAALTPHVAELIAHGEPPTTLMQRAEGIRLH